MERDLDLTVALFPGQGAYRPGALAGLWERGSDAVRGTFEVVDEVAKERLGQEVSPVLFRPSPPSPTALLQQAPDVLQLAIFATSVATHRLLAERGARPSVHLGHSLGEIAALTCAGAYDPADAAAVLCERISVVRDHDHSGGSLLALRCGRERAERLVTLIDHPALVVAVDNAADQTVVSGPADAIGTAADIARQLGVTATPLRSPHPFHNPLLAEARRELAARIGGFRRRPTTVPVYSPILGRFYRDGDDLAELLALHLVSPVEFRTSVAALHSAGARTFVEVGAGQVLTSLVAGARPGVHTAAPLAGRDEDEGLTAAADALRPPLSRAATAAPDTVAPMATASAPAPATTVATGSAVAAGSAVAGAGRRPVSAASAVAGARPGDHTAAPLAGRDEDEGLAAAADALRPPLSRAAATAPDTVAPVATASAPAPATTVATASAVAGAGRLPRSAASADVDRDELAGRVRALYAEAMEYPEEVFTDDVFLEADLGVDSVKQTELLSRVGDRFGLGVPPAGLRVADYDTFGKVVDFVALGVTSGGFTDTTAAR